MRFRLARVVLCSWTLSVAALASDISGIWVGQQPGRNNTTEDVAFQFRVAGDSITGKMFGDEFDLPIEEASVVGENVRFTITTTNYYSRTKMSFRYTGTLKGSTMELVRERVQRPDEKPDTRPIPNITLKLKRLI